MKLFLSKMPQHSILPRNLSKLFQSIITVKVWFGATLVVYSQPSIWLRPVSNLNVVH